MTLIVRIREDLTQAMREKNAKVVQALRLVTAAIKQIEVDERIVVDDARLLTLLDKMAKQRQESITQFQAAARTDLVDQEQFELALIQHYLPEPLSEEAIVAAIDEAFKQLNPTGMSDMGKIIAFLKPHLQGRADMGLVSARVKAKLV